MTTPDHSTIPPVSTQVSEAEAMNQRIRERRHKGGTKAKTVSSEGVQDYGTPPELIQAVERDFSKIAFDLAATSQNTVAPFWIEKDFRGADSLSADWLADYDYHKSNGVLWLNPPFSGVRPWMEKCRDESARGARILSLTKSSLDSNWYQEVVAPNAASWILKSRVKFVGCDTVFTQALMLTEWGTGKRGLGFWDWKRK